MRALAILTLCLSPLLTACASKPEIVAKTIDNRAEAYREALDLVDAAQSESLSTPCQTPEEAYSGPVHLQHSIIQTDIALAAYDCERERAAANVSLFGQVKSSLQSLLEKAE